MSAIILSQDHATGMYLDQNCRFIVYSILAKFLPHITISLFTSVIKMLTCEDQRDKNGSIVNFHMIKSNISLMIFTTTYVFIQPITMKR